VTEWAEVDWIRERKIGRELKLESRTKEGRGCRGWPDYVNASGLSGSCLPDA
jgi:hypothetical protein